MIMNKQEFLTCSGLQVQTLELWLQERWLIRLTRVEEGLQVDQHRVFACSDEVVAMEVSRAEQVQQRQISSLSLIKSAQRRNGATCLVRDKFRPAIEAAI